MRLLILCLVGLSLTHHGVLGHGMILDPASRSSLWRFNDKAPQNYNDNEVFCGGFSVQYNQMNGKCGLCGDRYDLPHPQPNENTGTYGQGIIARTYEVGSVIDINVLLTSNHRGNFKYSLCVLEDPTAPESGEDCFQPLNLGDGRTQYDVSDIEKQITHTLQLPSDLTCDRCVLRWKYTAGNNWGPCENGTYSEGCGPQETFVNCADIQIK